MIRLIYASSATIAFNENDLMQLLGKCRANNEKLDVSGLLLYAKENFFQILEGDEGVVEKLYADIASDTRHNGAIVIDRSEIEQRSFPNWSMGFKNLETFDRRKLRGYNDLFNRKLSKEEFGNLGQEIIYLIELFKEF
ncbi:BLUF domain-containing protein [Enterovibrio norvegicus]|uniref:BLUF domain-containing protein n=1 Tax=Enterovibrio norvegicus TaxID=188144 RepID=UPI00354D5940